MAGAVQRKARFAIVVTCCYNRVRHVILSTQIARRVFQTRCNLLPRFQLLYFHPLPRIPLPRMYIMPGRRAQSTSSAVWECCKLLSATYLQFIYS